MINRPHTLWHLLDAAAASQPDSTALISGDARVSYGALRAQSRSVAAGLRALGIGRGDTVAVWMPNTPLWLELLFACAHLGATVMAANTRFRSIELGDVLARSGARLLVYWPGFLGIPFSDILEGVAPAERASVKSIVAYGEPSPQRLWGREVMAADKLYRLPDACPPVGEAGDGCVMFTTSGTTSKPKLVLHTQQSVVAHAFDTVRALGYDAPGTVIEVVTPLCGVSGFGMPVAALAARAPCVLTPAFDERATIASIARHQVTHLHANHDIIRRMLDALRDGDDMRSVQAINCGSGIAGLIEGAATRGIRLRSIYGSSEMQARYARQPDELPLARRGEGGGFPVSPQAQVRVVDIESGAPLPVGEKGELLLRGPSQLREYYGDAQATARAISADGFVHTGDCGYLREDGSFVLEARIGDVLKLSGFMVSPAEIESLLLTYPGVTQCSVVGAHKDGRAVAVAFVRGAAVGESALLGWCRERIARYKVPARVVWLDEFPVTAGANAPKVLKSALRQRAQALLRGIAG